MAGRTQQYLRSEYIQPPPGPLTLDAKKSPLALLAQTCSAIGKDSTAVSSSGTSKTSMNSIQSMCNNTTPSISPRSTNMYHRKEAIKNGKQRKSDASDSRSPRTETSGHLSNSTQASPTSISAKSPVNVTNHYGAIINAKRQSPLLSGEADTATSKARRSPENNKLKISPTTMGSEAGARNRHLSNSPPSKHNRSLPGKDHETTHNCKDDSKKRRRVSQNNSPRKTHDSRSSPKHAVTTTSPIENQDAHQSKSGTTTIPAPQTAYLMGGKTPPLGHKQHLTYPSMLPCADRFCVACQIPHVPGGCELNSVKNTHTQNLLSLYSGLDPMTQNLGLTGGAVPPSYALQSQFMLAALAARNEMPNAYDATNVAAPHICNWVSANEGTCGKRFNTADELIEHLRSHALPSTSSATMDYIPNGLSFDKAYAAVGANSFSSYLNPQGLMFPGVGSGISASSHLASVALANERLLQSTQRRNSPLYRYHPYKASAVSHGGSYLPLAPPTTAASNLYCSPYSFYGQPMVAPSSGYVFP